MARFVDMSEDLFAPVRVSTSLAEAILRAVKQKPGLSGLKSLSRKKLSSLMRGTGLVFARRRRVLDIEFLVLTCEPQTGGVKIKFSLPLRGPAKEQNFLLRQIIYSQKLSGVAVNHDGIETSVFLRGAEAPVKAGNGYTSHAQIFCAAGEKAEASK